MEDRRIFSLLNIILFCMPALNARIHHPVTVDTVLFDPKKGVEILEASNFTEVVFNSKFNRVVVFYQATCGTCKKFAPVFQKLSDYCKEWDQLVKFSSVACSNIKNKPICQRFGIVRVPTLLFFHKDFSGKEKPIDIQSGKDVMLGNIARSLANYYQRKQDSLSDWPNLLPLKNDEFRNECKKHPKMFIIITNDQSEKRVGPLAVLNSVKMKNAHVRWMHDYDAQFLKFENHPSLLQTNTDCTETTLLSSKQRNDFNKLIADKVDYKTDNLFAPIDGKIIMEPSKKPVIGKPIIPNGLHEQDLESSLYHTLWQEISRLKHLNASSLNIAKRYIKSLMYVPYRKQVLKFLGEIDSELSEYSTISTDHFTQILEKNLHSKSYVPKRIVWAGCSGSKPEFRGYPCSLWMTFHAMTIGGLNKTDVAQIVRNIRDYVVNFFSCTKCAQNFEKETADLDKSIGKTDKDAVLYLWRIHNHVNERLSKEKDSLVDPRHPKLQFPGKTLCKECRIDDNADTFKEDVVFNFLQDFYGEVISNRASINYGKATNNKASFNTAWFTNILGVIVLLFLTNL
ncbi:DgyrCDS3056 [Dimorphilus gyrociliatus]|uniref:Sulfhydryl oxidase n=1 Tax=Dimorphilus gyrociliatus TaxID=2664684 RepID=A0A7I8VC22_9ANNE|nr:DgyrCDS3056 [Dimorphilus gyrociliatus]